jgi:hypothetical protein
MRLAAFVFPGAQRQWSKGDLSTLVAPSDARDSNRILADDKAPDSLLSRRPITKLGVDAQFR